MDHQRRLPSFLGYLPQVDIVEDGANAEGNCEKIAEVFDAAHDAYPDFTLRRMRSPIVTAKPVLVNQTTEGLIAFAMGT